MKPGSTLRWASLFLGLALVLVGSAGAQRVQGAKASARTAAYDLSREITLVGTVLQYTDNSETPPIGAHVLLQTASGAVDVHLGDARFLKMNRFTVTEGCTARVIGQFVANQAAGAASGVFLARIIQQGTQAIAVRSARGMPLWPAGARANAEAQSAEKQEGVL